MIIINIWEQHAGSFDHCASAASECKHLYYIAAAEVQVSVSDDDTVVCVSCILVCVFHPRDGKIWEEGAFRSADRGSRALSVLTGRKADLWEADVDRFKRRMQ